MATDAGVQTRCAACDLTVRQKAMIPMVGEGGQGVRYVCIGCARKAIVIRPDAGSTTADG